MKKGRRRRTKEPSQPAIQAAAAPPRGRIWFFRGLAVALPLLLIFPVLEGGLRLAGFGYPSSFLLPARVNGKAVFVQNRRFGWRFFGPEMAREPGPVVIARNKPPHTTRIFIFGESAAYGDPQPEFGLARMLEALLTLRFPGEKFEVINAAVTGISSHVILPLARDCVQGDGDIWVLYLGNNEVVGPYGAGSVFHDRPLPLPLIRASLALKTTRTGQALERLLSGFRPRPGNQLEWGGMEMFLNHQVRSDDPRLTWVYANFERNLADLLKTARRHGVKTLVSTVACNLRDCAPFASLHRLNLQPGELSRWDDLYKKGAELQARGACEPALEAFEQTAQIDDSFAELHFRRGQCRLGLNEDSKAAVEFIRACDDDALRFRCDTRVNQILARAASGREQDGILFTDSEAALARSSPHGVTGHEFFYEHVHLTFEGNYRLALNIAQALVPLLPDRGRQAVPDTAAWPPLEACARRLGWTDYDRYRGVAQMLGRLQDPPFTHQVNWAEETQALRAQLEQLLPASRPTGLRLAETRCRQALAAAPDDWFLSENLARVETALGNPSAAADAWQCVTHLLPYEVEAWQGLGANLSLAGRKEEAAAAYLEALRLDPRAIAAMTALADLRLAQHDCTNASAYYSRTLKLKPYFSPAHLGLGRALEAMGRAAEAQNHYQEALKNRLNTSASYKALGQLCFQKGWYAQAATNFLDALRLNPADVQTHVNAGLTLSLLGRSAEARSHYAEAVRLDPGLAEAHFRLGTLLGKEGDDAGALEQFAAAVHANPDLLEARLNLGIALSRQRRNAAAAEQFQEVLRRQPDNLIALQYLRSLTNSPTPPP